MRKLQNIPEEPNMGNHHFDMQIQTFTQKKKAHDLQGCPKANIGNNRENIKGNYILMDQLQKYYCKKTESSL